MKYYKCKHCGRIFVTDNGEQKNIRDMIDKTIGIAEEEIKEKANQAFCKTVCGEKNTDCGSCTLIKTFADYYK